MSTKYAWEEDLEIHSFYWNRFFQTLSEKADDLSGKRILDMGCGTGVVASKFAEGISKNGRLQVPAKVIGVDLDEDTIQEAQRSTKDRGLENIEFNTCDVTSALPFADESFHIVVSTAVLHNFESEIKDGIIKEISRVLKPLGQLLLIDVMFVNDSERHQCSHIDGVRDRIESEVQSLPERVKWRLKEIAIRDDSPFNLVMTERDEYPENVDYVVRLYYNSMAFLI